MSVLLKTRKASVALRRLPGTFPLINALRKANYKAGTMIVDDFDGDLKLELDLGEHMASRSFWFGYYERDVIIALRRFLKPGDVFLDVGANIGEMTLYAAKHVGPSGIVYAFEPIPHLAARLAKNVMLNRFKNVHIVRRGVSDASGEAAIYIQKGPYKDGSVHRGLGTLFPTKDRELNAGTVILDTLDNFASRKRIGRIDGIKLDIEGAEFPALKGASEILRSFKPWLIIEIDKDTCAAAGHQPGEIFRFLERFGYRCDTIGRKGRLKPVDINRLKEVQNIFCTASVHAQRGT
jgi:FkbM family methyltransferase